MRITDDVFGPLSRTRPTQHGASDPLVRATCAVAGAAPDSLTSLFDSAGLMQSSALMLKRPDRARSRLNANGVPWQACLSQRAPGTEPEVRFLIDPFFDQAPQDRHGLSLGFASTCIAALGQDKPWHRMIERTQATEAGTLWIAGRLGPGIACPLAGGLALYFNAECFGQTSPAEALDGLIPHSAALGRFLARWAGAAHLVSIAVEIGPAPYPPRVKAYLRIASDAARRSLAKAAPGTEDWLPGATEGSASGLTFGFSFCPETGAPDGLKVDVCLCPRCAAIAKRGPMAERRLREVMPSAAPMLSAGRLALLGFGTGGKGARVNAYLEPQP